jgi:hypothetical protein
MELKSPISSHFLHAGNDLALSHIQIHYEIIVLQAITFIRHDLMSLL